MPIMMEQMLWLHASISHWRITITKCINHIRIKLTNKL